MRQTITCSCTGQATEAVPRGLMNSSSRSPEDHRSKSSIPVSSVPPKIPPVDFGDVPVAALKPFRPFPCRGVWRTGVSILRVRFSTVLDFGQQRSAKKRELCPGPSGCPFDPNRLSGITSESYSSAGRSTAAFDLFQKSGHQPTSNGSRGVREEARAPPGTVRVPLRPKWFIRRHAEK